MAVVSLKFLERLPKYEHEKPFFASVAAEVGFQEDIHTNLNLKEIGVPITDIRPKIQTFKLQDCGFEVIPHESTNLDFQTEQDTIAYTKETAAWLKRHFDAEHVVCWDFKVSI
jgi:hypothetical protein